MSNKICREKYALDEIDLKIAHHLSTDGRMTISKLSEEIGTSRPTVKSRMDYMSEKELLKVRGGLDIKKIGYKIVCAGLRIEDDIEKIVDYVAMCPRVLYVFRGFGDSDLMIYLWGENHETLQSTINSFESLGDLTVVFTHFLGTPLHGDILIDLGHERKDGTPCGLECGECVRYESNWCVGCPSCVDYKSQYNPL